MVIVPHATGVNSVYYFALAMVAELRVYSTNGLIVGVDCTNMYYYSRYLLIPMNRSQMYSHTMLQHLVLFTA